MGLFFWIKTSKSVKRRSRLKHKTPRHRQFQRRDSEILLKLDAIMTFLRKHNMEIGLTS